jgi:cobalt/nickel transport system permease protein
MHMADALISPQVGAVMWGATALTAAYCVKKVREEADESKIPLMAVAGAFVFAAQMLNFSIPGTGSSGHLGGGLILTVLLGPYAAFLVMASVLGVQALFFADGGLLALGANIFNLGFFPAFIAFPFVYKKLVGDNPTAKRLLVGGMLGAIIGLQLGAFGVVLETTASGISELPFGTFIALMQPIHLAIGVVEGLVTAGVIAFVYKAQPEILTRSAKSESLRGLQLKPVLIALLAAAIVSGAVLAWFASPDLDGLEWSIAGVSGEPEVAGAGDSAIHENLAGIQDGTAFMPDYAFPVAAAEAEGDAGETEPAWPAVDAGTSVAGIVGALITLGVAAVVGLLLKRRGAAGAGVPPAPESA